MAIAMGRVIRKAADAMFDATPNGLHIHCLFLRDCFPDTVGFHDLARTGYLFLLELLWEMQIAAAVHSSRLHKGQRTQLLCGMLRRTMPLSAIRDLYDNNPGLSLLR